MARPWLMPWLQVVSSRFDDEDNITQTLHLARSDASGTAKFDLQPLSAGGANFGRAVAFKDGLALGGVELRAGKRAIQLVSPIAATGTGARRKRRASCGRASLRFGPHIPRPTAIGCSSTATTRQPLKR